MTATVLLGAFWHETNTFVDEPTKREDFRTRDEYFGDDIAHEMRGTETAVGGVLEVADRRGVDLLATVAAYATPGGPVTRDAYEYYADYIVDEARDRVGEIDGVILPLHGAMVPEGGEDGEGPLISRIRKVVGPDVPIVVTLDLHGNVTAEMTRNADALVAYETNPHLDKAETGQVGMEILADAIADTVDPVVHVESPPMLPEVPKQYTDDDPMAKVMERARELERSHEDVLKVSVLPGFYHADIAEAGLTVPVVTDGDEMLAERVAKTLATELWEMREAFVGNYPKPSEAVDKARRLASVKRLPGPIVMADFGPNPGAGGSASGTTVLREFLEQEVPNAGYTLLWDPATVERCIDAGVGERVTVDLGGWGDDLHGEPIEGVDGYVKAITDGTFVNTGTSHDGEGTTRKLGRTVRLQCGVDDSVAVIVTETRSMSFDAEIWRHVGVQPERLDVIAVPSLAAFRGDYGPFASHIIEVDTPGLSSPVASRFEYELLERPVYPLDEMDDDSYPNE
jgi:microcystin degradation protein MlrC